jgi:low temperature requirement protein LtrA
VIARCTALAAVVCVAGSFVSDRSAPIWANPASFALGIAMTLALVPLFTVHLGRLSASNQLDRDHLAERMGQLVIIALGESFADLVLSLGDRDSIPNPMYVILTFAVVYAMWAIYFRTVLPAGVPAGPSRTRGWIAAHALLIFGAIGTAAGFSGLAIAPLGDPAVTLASSRLPLPLLYVMVGFVLLTWIAGGLDRRFLRVHVAAAGSLLLVVLVSVLVIRDQAVVMGMVGACIVLADAAVIAWMSRGRGPLSALLRPAVRDSS